MMIVLCVSRVVDRMPHKQWKNSTKQTHRKEELKVIKVFSSINYYMPTMPYFHFLLFCICLSAV